MPTFFSRRYMRGQPSRRERALGAVILALTALIVGCFLLTGGLLDGFLGESRAVSAARRGLGMPDQPLFLASEESMKRPPPPHEFRAAEAMLPLAPENWTRIELKVVSLEPAPGAPAPDPSAADREAAFRKAATDHYGLDKAYQAVYEQGDERLIVLIADAGAPEAAYGLWKMLRASGAAIFPVGRSGWLSPDAAAAFWAGRYYTEVIRVSASTAKPAADQVGETAEDAGTRGGASGPSAPGSVEQLARAAASVQINYGGPFWADAVLPQAGRVEDSVGYVKKRGLGMDELTDCWWADYSDGLQLAVLKPTSPEKLIGALRSRFEAAAQRAASPAVRLAADEERESGGYGEEEGEAYGSAASESEAAEPAGGAVASDLSASLGPEVAAGTLGGRTLVAHAAGPYVFVAVGPKADAVVALARSAHEHAKQLAPEGAPGATALMAAGGSGRAPSSGRARFADVPGGSIRTPPKIERFTDNLYEKIDGREGQFRAFGFMELRFGQYQDARNQATFDVYIYDMGQPNNAMGIYMAEKSEGADPLELGGEGYLSGANVYYYKGRYYVNVLGPSEAGGAAVDASKQIGRAIAETIPDSGTRLWADGLLPREGRLDSIRYQATSALAHDFLERFFFASYEIDKTKFEMFIHKAPDPKQAAELFARYATETAKYETVVSRERTDGGETLLSDSLDNYTVAFHKGVYFAGVANCKKNRELAVRQAAMLREKLNPNDPGEPAPPRPAPSQESQGGEQHGY